MAARLMKMAVHALPAFGDFPAFPVFPAESLVLAGNRTPYRWGLAVPSDGTQPDGTRAASLSQQYERIDDAYSGSLAETIANCSTSK
jgi:hypothetical protein